MLCVCSLLFFFVCCLESLFRVVYCVLFVVCCSLLVVGCLYFVGSCALFVVGYELFVDCCVAFVRRLLSVVCYVLCYALLCVVCCLLIVVSCCSMFVVGRLLFDVRC